jgi:hypothetical protein
MFDAPSLLVSFAPPILWVKLFKNYIFSFKIRLVFLYMCKKLLWEVQRSTRF